MSKNSKNQCVEDSFVASNCSIKSNIKKWLNAELERLDSRGKDIENFVEQIANI